MLISLSAIRYGPLHDFEAKKESRCLTGYTLFLSHFYLEWKRLPHNVRLECLIVGEGQDSDCDSVDSPTTMLNNDVIRHAA